MVTWLPQPCPGSPHTGAQTLLRKRVTGDCYRRDRMDEEELGRLREWHWVLLVLLPGLDGSDTVRRPHFVTQRR